MKTAMPFLCFLFLLLLSLRLGAQDARQIADNAAKAIEFDAMEMTATLHIHDDKGNVRTRQIANASKQFGAVGKNLMKFLAPADVKGTAMLIYDYENKPDDIWIFLPALRKVRRVLSSEKSKSFMGSEFSNADMSRPDLGQFSHKLLGAATLDGKDCWKLEALSLSDAVADEYGFHRKVSWVEKSTFLTRKMEYYDASGRLLKTMTLKDYRKQPNGRYFAFSMEMQNGLNKRRSVISVDQFQLGSKLAEDYFSAGNLERL